jgi:hypothetical protein
MKKIIIIVVIVVLIAGALGAAWYFTRKKKAASDTSDDSEGSSYQAKGPAVTSEFKNWLNSAKPGIATAIKGTGSSRKAPSGLATGAVTGLLASNAANAKGTEKTA